MIRSRLLLRFGTYGIVIALITLLLTQLTTAWLRNFTEKEHRRANVGPFAMVTALLNGIAPADRGTILTRIRDRDPRDFVANRIMLYDERMQIIYPTNANAETIAPPAPDEPLIELAGVPRQFIRHADVRRLGPGPGGDPPGPPGLGSFAGLVLIQTIALFAAVLSTVLALLWNLRAKGRLAEDVIDQLRGGNLTARFQIGPADEIGQVMISFNKMADEIERLVESLRKTEASRRNLLRELAHDLRTPIASLKSLIETVHDHADRLDPARRTDLLGTALDETKYFATLVEDLLFLGRVDEPGYRVENKSVDLTELVTDEASRVAHRYPNVTLSLDILNSVRVDGDLHQYRRLVRNACDNAFSFAHSAVHVSLTRAGAYVRLTVADDGPGLDDRALAGFGHKKFSREVQTDQTGARISVGLGSVIMKSIAEAHRGRIEVRNQSTQTNKTGAILEITLPVPSVVNS